MMKRRLAYLVAFAAIAAMNSQAEGTPFRPPSVPLVVNDPYLSLWSPADKLTDSETMHWSRDVQPLTILGEVNGKTWRFCGKSPEDIPAARQLTLKVGCTETVYAFEADGAPVEIRFSTPVIPGNWNVFSRPVTYLTVKGAKAKVSISPAFATDDDAAEMVTNHTEVAGCKAHSIGRKVQCDHEVGDRVRPNAGQVWLVDAGDHFLVAYDFASEISFLGKSAPAWWKRLPHPFHTRFKWMLGDAVRDYPRLMAKMSAFDAEMNARFEKVGGGKYAKMAALAWRQSFGACRLATAQNGDMLFFTKENTSNGCIGTVDILYPQMPHLMLAGVELLKAAIRPDMLYAVSGAWPYPYAPHDLGKFPKAHGQDYGMSPGKTDADRMPVEESGNLIIALYAVARMEGHADFADAWWPTVRQWADYLRQFGFDPENQLCTDDFAGHLAHNANLSVKTIVAFESFSRLAGLRGDAVLAREYHDLAVSGAKQWVLRAQGGKSGATCLAFGEKGTWSLKYNLAMARALGIDLFPAAIVRDEVAAYLKNTDRFGTPLDNREHWCKVDWLFWCAAMAENRRDFEALTDPVYGFLNATKDRVAFPDLYFTETAACTRYGKGADQFIGFNARPVIGGIYLPVVGVLDAAAIQPAATAKDAAWFKVAAANSRDEARAAADLVCSGTNDERAINRALRICKAKGKNLFLFDGRYDLWSVNEFGDGGPRAAIVIPNMKRHFVLAGERASSTLLRLRPEAFDGIDEKESVDAVRGEWTYRGQVNRSNLELSNLMVYVPDPSRACRAVDLRRVATVKVSCLRLVAFGEAVLKGLAYPYGDLSVPNEECIGLTMTDGSNSMPAVFNEVFTRGFGQGIQVGGEHVVMTDCASMFGGYGYTFGNYEYFCGFNHPITMINCCDEQNIHMPLFASCGDNGGALHGRQEVTMISFNLERVGDHAPGGKLGSRMREVRPGTWRGQIGFTLQPRWSDVNSVDEPLWADDGSGKGFRTVNNAHKSACSSEERRSYAPQYQQQLYDTDLNKLLICTDPEKRIWRDALGNVVK